MIDVKTKVAPRLGRVPTLGVIMDWIGEPYQMGILAGILDTANSAGVNVWCFVGGALQPEWENDARNRIFALAGAHLLDGAVLLSSSLMHKVGLPGLKHFCEVCVGPLPRASIGVSFPGTPGVVLNNSFGIAECIDHLVVQHRYRKIAFVRGPLANQEAESRFQAYVAGLQKHSLPYDPKLVITGDFTMPGGRTAARGLSQIPGVRLSDLDAIVVSNDLMAIGITMVLEELGMSVPATVAVTGFDDIEEARLVASPLTTVRQPLEKLGSRAARDVLQWVQFGTVAEDVTVDAELVVRSSCGCVRELSPARQSIVPEQSHSFEVALTMRRQRILDVMTRTAGGHLGLLGADWQGKFLNSFIGDLRGEKPGAFMLAVQAMAQKLLVRGMDPQVCHDVVDALRKQIALTLRAEPVRRGQAEDLFYVAQLTLSEARYRNMMRGKLQLTRWVREISDACNAISGAAGEAEYCNNVSEQFARLGLKNFFVVRYSEADKRRAEVMVGTVAGRECNPLHQQPFDIAEVLPLAHLDAMRDSKALVIMPLYYKHLGLGYMVLELNTELSLCYGSLSEAMGIGLHGIGSLTSSPT